MQLVEFEQVWQLLGQLLHLPLLRKKPLEQEVQVCLELMKEQAAQLLNVHAQQDELVR